MRVVDLFSGAGGLALGAELAGLNVVVSVDNWDCALETLARNVAHPIEKMDLSNIEQTVDLISSYSPDIIIGGPPCQDFSCAGIGVEGDRATLTVSFAKTVARVRPEFFVMENVPNAAHSQAYSQAKDIFISCGYALDECVLDASFFGVPQRRRRFIVIGTLRDGLGSVHESIHSHESILPVTVRKYWSDVPFEHYYRHPRTYARRAVFSVDEPSPTIRGVSRPRPASYKVHPNDSSSDPHVRALTTMERAKIQTFPDEYKWSGTREEIDQMIGNAVPVDLSRHVFQGIHSWSQGSYDGHPSFRTWIQQVHGFTPRAAGDVLSRLRRVYKNLSPNMMSREIEIQELLEIGVGQSAPTARAQISRAVSLYREYADMNN